MYILHDVICSYKDNLGVFRYNLIFLHMIKQKLLCDAKDYHVGSIDLKEYLNRPINLGFITVVVCDQGSATLSCNFKKHNLRAGAILILFGGVNLITLDVTDDFSASIYAVSENMADMLPYKEHHHLFSFLHKNPILKLTGEQRKRLKEWQSLIGYSLEQNNDQYIKRLLINALSGFFLSVEMEVKKKNDLSTVEFQDQKFSITANKLMKLVVEHIRENRNLTFFADKLNVTPGYLHKVMRKEFNRSPKDFIDCFALSEIKGMLTTTDLSVKEIADEMNFNDPSYLSRFFTKHTGISMIKFRTAFYQAKE